VTLYVTLRSGAGGRDLAPSARVIESPGVGPNPSVRFLSDLEAAKTAAGRTVVFMIHGFNVTYAKGLRSLALLDGRLRQLLPAHFLPVGVLWPGDAVIPVINYPGEWRDAVRSGRLLARYANTVLGAAEDICFLSHSLGGRLALEAVANLDRKAARVCLTAAATDDDCLEAPYDVSLRNSGRLTYVASRKDIVLRLAYPIGDWFGDVFLGDRDSPVRGALGRYGPRWSRPAAPSVPGVKLGDGLKYDHGDYFPPGEAGADLTERQARVAAFAATFLAGGAVAWPA